MKIREAILLYIVILLLNACMPEEDSDNSSGHGSGVDPSIKGYLYFDHPGTYIQYAIANSEVRELYDREGSGVSPEYGLLSAAHSTPVSVPDDYSTDEVFITDNHDLDVMYLPLTESVYNPVKFSPDGRLIAFKWWPKSYYDSGLEKGLVVFDLNGNKVQLS